MRKWLYIAIIFIGLLQAIGYVSGIKTLRGLGAATGSSPLPIVFTEVRGVETFAADFFIEYSDAARIAHRVQITPEMYSKLRGPYNRRNIYGAAISYGPIMEKELWSAVLNYGLCNKILLQEMALPESGTDYRIRIITKTAGRNQEWLLKPECK